METLVDREGLISSPPQLGCALYVPGLPGGSNKVHDRSPYGNIGTITGATWIRLPSGLWCLSFDGGDDTVNCGADASLQFGTGDFAVIVWLNSSSDKSWQYIASNRGASGPWYVARLGSGYPQLYITDGTNTADIGGDTLVNDGIWHLIEFWFGRADATACKIIVDGVEQTYSEQDDPTGVGSLSNTTDLHLGSHGGGDHWFLGSIALQRIVRGMPSKLDAQNIFNREKHLFGVW